MPEATAQTKLLELFSQTVKGLLEQLFSSLGPHGRLPPWKAGQDN